MSRETQHETTLAVIAGGAGSRMGGPKHSLRIGGVPILTDLLRRVQWVGPTVLVLGATDRECVPGADAFGAVLHDSAPGRGPLFGVFEALEVCRSESMIAIPVDMCELGAEHLEWVRARGAADARHGLMCRRRDGSVSCIEPFPLFIRRSAAPALRDILAGTDVSVRGLADHGGFIVVNAPREWPDEVWANINTPADLAEVVRRRGYTESNGRGLCEWGGAERSSHPASEGRSS